ncbi:sulfite exporter TauE/SafE family protein [Brasilonema sp. UFV-L1]|uniref:nickel/cobalt transporter n=1 Tax=Brasilonema sp. UFV-L1 TaxID=2234130 RepID=UPI00145F0D88|nr:sulfite exporter TauE/SafE family protein [Brasilonema sp. UFV-L1]NMG09644.1 high frequency lysogenization protein HflD [Brasilonema sp. UFV-L1]
MRFISIVSFAFLVTFVPSQPALAHIGHGSFLTQNLARMTLSPTLMLSGIGIALIAGAGHALSPGHGKTMVAAYLVGSRGTPQQAVVLSLVTTLTHTISVFALGIVALLLSQYILPDNLYPLLSFFSGLMVCGVGFWLLDRHLNPAPKHHHHHTHNDCPDHIHSPSDSQVTLQSLLTLGIAGGLVPCPSALVLLLSAIALHQTAYGLLLVCAFSFGLAVVLVSVGLLVIYAHHWLKRFSWVEPLQQYTPKMSAIAVIAVGSILMAFAVI